MYIYLVQGQAELIKNYLFLAQRPGCTAYYLTYDKPLEGTIYFPDSTWAEGRNRLLEEALQHHKVFDYVIYADDDLEFYHGDWDAFEAGLQKFCPKIAVPVFDRTVQYVLSYPLFQVQSFSFNDEQLMAFRFDVVMESKVLPYETRFDELHWWATCRLQQILIQNYYQNDILQFNFTRVSNLEHDRYTFENNDESHYKDEVLNWVRQHHAQVFRDVCKTPSKFSLLKNTLKTALKSKNFKLRSVFGSLKSTFQKSWKKSKTIDIDDLPEVLTNLENWVIYGYGDIGKQILKKLRPNSLNTCTPKIVDRRAFEKDITEDDALIQSPDSIEPTPQTKVIVASYSFVKQIEFFLKFGIGLNSSQVYLLKRHGDNR